MKTQIILRKVHYAFSAFLCTACLVSCNDWLKPEPLSFYSPENTYVTKEGLEGALVSTSGVYRQ